MSKARFSTVPWAPGLELEQLDRVHYVAMRSAGVVWQHGIRKGFARETVQARLTAHSDHPMSPSSDRMTRLALELGLIDEECDYLAEELWRPR